MGDTRNEEAENAFGEHAADVIIPLAIPSQMLDAPTRLLSFDVTSQSIDTAQEVGEDGRSDDALTAPTVHTRLLQALPHISQWLQDVNQTQQALRRQTSSSDDVVRGPGQMFGTTTAPSELSARPSRRGVAPLRSISHESDRSPQVTDNVVSGSGPMNTIHVDAAAESGVASSRLAAGGARNDDGEHRQNVDEAAGNEEQTAMEELQGIFRRCHHTLPFLALFVVYFAYQHAIGILLFVFGTIAVMGLDKRVQNQIALKENASTPHLLCAILMCCVDTFAICYLDGDASPVRHFLKQREMGERTAGVFGDVVWMILVNDFLVRLLSLMIKALVAGIKCNHCPFTTDKHAQSSLESTATSPPLDETNEQETFLARASRASLVSFYRRKRKLYAIIEMSSLFIRSVLAGIPWCAYYQLSSSKLMADVFTFAYLIIKGLTLGSQARRVYRVAQSFVTLKLDFGAYVAQEDLIEAGSPDCSICYESMQLPVKLSCSHMFCEECVTEWFDRERSCPLCRADVTTANQSEGDVSPRYLDSTTSLVPQLL